MLGSGVLNVVLGIIFIFLLYSLLATALREAIASLLNHRAAMLYDGIKSMLTNTPEKGHGLKKLITWFAEPFIGFANGFISLFKKSEPKTIYDKFYDHPVIKNYGQNSYFDKPSYLSQSNFSEILLSVIKDLDKANWGKPATTAMIQNVLDSKDFSKGMDADLKRILNHHLSEAAGDVNVFRSRLEQWYNDTMDRVSGWYTRSTHFWLFGIGLFLATTLNIDTIQIADYLSKNPDKAKQLADAGVAYSNAQNKGELTDTAKRNYGDNMSRAALDSLHNQLSNVNTLLGLGYGCYGLEDSSYLADLIAFAHGPKPCPLRHPLHRLLYCTLDSFKCKLDSCKCAAASLNKITPHDFARAQVIYPKLQQGDWGVLELWFIGRKLTWVRFFSFFITAVGIGMGAPFWFDMLNKMAKLRTAGNAAGTAPAPAANAQSTTQIDG